MRSAAEGTADYADSCASGALRRLRPPAAEKGNREELLTAVALLDEEFARGEDPTPEAREAYHARRERLLTELRRRS